MPQKTHHAPLFDRRLLRVRRNRAIRLGGDGFLLQLASEELRDRLEMNLRHFSPVLCLGDPSPSLAQAMLQSGKADDVISADLNHIPSQPGNIPALILDEEHLPFRKGNFELIVSAMNLQWVNDLPGTLRRLRQLLKPDGLFLGVMAGGQTLIELRTALHAAEDTLEGGVSPRVAPVADLRQTGDLLLGAGFAAPVIDSDIRTIRYDSAMSLMHDLRRLGATNTLSARRKKPLRRKTLSYAAEFYQDHFSDPDGRIRASFEFIYMSGWQRQKGRDD